MPGKQGRSRFGAAWELGLNSAGLGFNRCSREGLLQSHQVWGSIVGGIEKTKQRPCFFLGSISGDSNSAGVIWGPRNTYFSWFFPGSSSRWQTEQKPSPLFSFSCQHTWNHSHGGEDESPTTARRSEKLQGGGAGNLLLQVRKRRDSNWKLNPVEGTMALHWQRCREAAKSVWAGVGNE